MDLPSIVIVGAGGHAKVVIEIIRAQGLFKPDVCVGSSSNEPEILDVPVIDGDNNLPDLRRMGHRLAFAAVGNNKLRERLGKMLLELEFELPTIIHPSAVISASARIGVGVIIMPRVVVNAEAQIEDLAILNTGSIIEHECFVGAASHIGPGSVLTGNVRVGQRVFFGAGTVVKPSVRIKDDVTSGSGAVLVSDVESNLTVVGVPAYPLRQSEDRRS